MNVLKPSAPSAVRTWSVDVNTIRNPEGRIAVNALAGRWSYPQGSPTGPLALAEAQHPVRDHVSQDLRGALANG